MEYRGIRQEVNIPLFKYLGKEDLKLDIVDARTSQNVIKERLSIIMKLHRLRYSKEI